MFLECTKKERMFQKTSKDTTEYEVKHLNSSLVSLHVKEKNIRDMQKCKTNRSTLISLELHSHPSLQTQSSYQLSQLKSYKPKVLIN